MDFLILARSEGAFDKEFTSCIVKQPVEHLFCSERRTISRRILNSFQRFLVRCVLSFPLGVFVIGCLLLFGDVRTLQAGVEPEADIAALEVNFPFGSTLLTPETQMTLDTLGEALSSDELRHQRIQIEAHTDSVGPEEYNQLLSELRAQGIKWYLVRRYGLDPHYLIVRGYGGSKPIADNNTDEGRSKNRRLQIMNLGPTSVAVSALISALQSSEETKRQEAAQTLGDMGAAAKDAVPTLINILLTKDSIERWAATEALGRIGAEAKDAVRSCQIVWK
jgi:hypothetical protein